MGEVVQLRKPRNALIITTMVSCHDDGTPIFIMKMRDETGVFHWGIPMTLVSELFKVIGAKNSAQLENQAVRCTDLELGNYIEDVWIKVNEAKPKSA